MTLGSLMLMALGVAWLLLAWLLADARKPASVAEPDPPAWMMRQIFDDVR